MPDILEIANYALDVWSHTFDVEITVNYGRAAAKDAYENAPELVQALVDELEAWRDIAHDRMRVDSPEDVPWLVQPPQSTEEIRPALDEAALHLLKTNPEEFFRSTRRRLP